MKGNLPCLRLILNALGHSLPGINETPDLRSTDSSSSIGQGGNLGFSSGDSSIHVIPGISEFLKLMIPVEHFGRSLHVTPGISELLISIKSSIGHGGKATFRIKRMCHYKLQFGFFY